MQKTTKVLSQYSQYSDNRLSWSKIYEWIEYFKKGRTSTYNEERSGKPSMSRSENNIQASERMVWEKRLPLFVISQWTILWRL
jgi:hypothetical protein